MNSLVVYCNVKTHDICEINVTTKRDIKTENIPFPGVWEYKRRSDIKTGDITKVRVYVIAATRAQFTGSHNDEGKWVSFAITLRTPVCLASDHQG